jgi:tetratricopeptide (TPR) repeat protein
MTSSAQAYRYYLYGMEIWYREGASKNALDWLLKAVEIDSNFIMAQVFIAYGYNNFAWYNERDTTSWKKAREWQKNVYAQKDKIPYKYQLFLEAHRCEFEKKPRERIEWIKKYIAIDAHSWEMWWNLGWIYQRLEELEKSIEPFQEAIEFGLQWKNYDKAAWPLINLMFIYTELGRYDNALKLCNKALKNIPEDNFYYNDIKILNNLIAGIADDDTIKIDQSIKAQRQSLINQGYPEAFMAGILSDNYNLLKDDAIAEKYYREDLRFLPENEYIINNLAYFLIDREINLIEGITLAKRAFQKDSLNAGIRATLGWGYFKQGKIEQAFRLLKKADDLTAKYEHRIRKQLEEVRKALAKQQ